MTVKHETNVADKLRAVRGADDVISRLHAGSIEGKAERIAEALSESEYGPAQLHGVYGKVQFALASNKRGETFRVKVFEEADKIRLGKVEVFDVASPIKDVAEEILETAMTAANAILDEDYDTASPMVTAVARALDVKGDLSRRVNLELDLQTVKNSHWYDSVVAECYKGDEPELPVAVIDEDDAETSLKGCIDGLSQTLRSELAEAGKALEGVKSENVDQTVLDAAASVVEDIKHALDALKNVDRDSGPEMAKVYEGVVNQASRLIKGARFVTELVRNVARKGDSEQ